MKDMNDLGNDGRLHARQSARSLQTPDIRRRVREAEASRNVGMGVLVAANESVAERWWLLIPHCRRRMAIKRAWSSSEAP